MRVGLDFDNTVVCYDALFARCAREAGLVPPDTPEAKKAVRDTIRRLHGNGPWVELQAEVYARRILEAEPAPGFLEFLEGCERRQVWLAVISHKTRAPAAAPDLDLHGAARSWLEHHRLEDRGVPRERWFFETTREAKLTRVAREGCTHFVDDLEEIFREPGFPAGVARLLYDPHGTARVPAGVRRFGHWREIGSWLWGENAS